MKKTIYGLIFVTLLCGCSSDLKIIFKNSIIVEYGENLKVNMLVDKRNSEKGCKIKKIHNFDNKKLGLQKVDITFISVDKNKSSKKKVNITVKDTKPPKIDVTSDSIDVVLGSEIDVLANVKSVIDPIDGKLNYFTTAVKKNGYYISGAIPDTTKEGTLTINILAFDKHGNKSVKKIKYVIKANISTSDEKGVTEIEKDTMQGNEEKKQNQSPSYSPNNDSMTNPIPETSNPGTKPPTNNVLCSGGIIPSKSCDLIVDGDGKIGNSGLWTSSREEAIEACYWIRDPKSIWRLQGFNHSRIDETEWNDRRIKYTVVFY